MSRFLIAALAILACTAVAVNAQGSGTWGVFADGGCNISLFSSTFLSGQCTAQASGSSTVYFITTCSTEGGETAWAMVEYEDAGCTTPKAGSTMTGKSKQCFPNAGYYGRVVCPSSATEAVPTSALVDPVGPVSAASAAAPLPLFALAVAAIVALFA